MSVTGIPLISGFKLDNNELIDKRSGPYISTAAALTALTNNRSIGLIVYIAIGTLHYDDAGHIVSADDTIPYIFKSGLTDAELIPFIANIDDVDTTPA